MEKESIQLNLMIEMQKQLLESGLIESEQEKFIVKLNVKLGEAMAYLVNEDYERVLQALGDQSDIIEEYINKNNLFEYGQKGNNNETI